MSKNTIYFLFKGIPFQIILLFCLAGYASANQKNKEDDVIKESPFLLRHSLYSSDTLPSAGLFKDSSKAPAKKNIFTRSYLTGNWWGARTYLAKRGVVFDLRYTSSYQGLMSGTGNKVFDYGGKIDALINLDTRKMGLWKGGGFRSHIEYAHGDLKPNVGGALFAENTAQFWPVGAKEELVATSLYFSQIAGDQFTFLLGKINPIDLLIRDQFFGGWGIDRFMNLIFTAPPSGLVPPVFMGGVASFTSKQVILTLMVFDPDNRTTDYFPGDLFKNGVNFSLTATHNTEMAGRKTSFAITTNFSTAEGTDYSLLQPGVESQSTKKGSYNISLQCSHNLQENKEKPEEAWGFYIKAAIADGNPNYVKTSFIAGIGGRSLFLRRPEDNFGIGAFYYNLSDVLQNTLSPGTEFKDESAIELYYNFSVAPWLYVGADLQYVNPAAGGNDNALVGSLRTQIRF